MNVSVELRRGERLDCGQLGVERAVGIYGISGEVGKVFFSTAFLENGRKVICSYQTSA